MALLRRQAEADAVPSDWAYVHNFAQANQPRARRMGEGQEILTAVAEAIGGALAETAENLQHAVRGLLGTTKRVSWPYLGISAALALVVLGVRRWRAGARDLVGLLRALVPPEVYLHRSSIQDYLWFVLSPAVHLPLLASFAFLSPLTSTWVHETMIAHLGPIRRLVPSVPVQIAGSFGLLLLIDLGNYVSHWLLHRVPFLWEFHKTHHSAEVLNPFTADRLHPLERWLIACCVGVCSGAAIGAIAWAYWPHFDTAKIMGINAFAFLTNVMSGNLRHSHVWISYGPVLEHVISSPAQHQIHHSRHPDHLDKNLATHFALWDWLFGTLYVPSGKPQALDLGLADRTEHLYRNPWALFWQPVRGNWARLRARLAPGVT